MARTFTKLFASITESTIWVAPDQHLRLWVYMLANADQDGNVWGSVPGIANHARLPVEAVEAALKSFMSPDPYSRTKALEGRRVVEIEGGWHLINHAKYRALMSAEDRRAKNRKYKQDERARRGHVSTGQQESAVSAQAEAEAEAGKSNPLSGASAPDVVPAGRKGGQARATREVRAVAERAIEYLNAKAGTRFRLVEANLKLPAARILRDGATEQELRAVVDLKVAEAARGEFDRKYLRPATLWNAEKFAQYLGLVSAGAPARKPDELAKVYGETEAGEQHFIAEVAAGKPEEIARRVLAEYRSAPWMRSTRTVVVKYGAEARRYAVEEISL